MHGLGRLERGGEIATADSGKLHGQVGADRTVPIRQRVACHELPALAGSWRPRVVCPGPLPPPPPPSSSVPCNCRWRAVLPVGVLRCRDAPMSGRTAGGAVSQRVCSASATRNCLAFALVRLAGRPGGAAAVHSAARHCARLRGSLVCADARKTTVRGCWRLHVIQLVVGLGPIGGTGLLEARVTATWLTSAAGCRPSAIRSLLANQRS